MILEDIMLNEIAQTQKGKYYIISLIWDTVIEFIAVESRTVVANGGWGMFNEHRTVVLQDEKRSGGERQWWLHNSVNVLKALSCMLKNGDSGTILCYVYLFYQTENNQMLPGLRPEYKEDNFFFFFFFF